VEPIYLHLDIDGYNFELMEMKREGMFEVTRVIPSTGVNFFFSHNGKFLLSNKLSIVDLEDPIDKEIEFWPEFSETFHIERTHHKRFHGQNCSTKLSF
jgi:hypothetical protein